jgi:hypothetical protein
VLEIETRDWKTKTMDLVFIDKPRDDYNNKLDQSFFIVSTTNHEKKPHMTSTVLKAGKVPTHSGSLNDASIICPGACLEE